MINPPKSTFTCLRKSLAQLESLPKKAVRLLFIILLWDSLATGTQVSLHRGNQKNTRAQLAMD